MTTVRELMKLYEDGNIDYPQLLESLSSQEFSPHTPAHQLSGWDEVYHRAEKGPDDNSFFWIEQAEFMELLTEEQVEEIAASIDQYQGLT